MNNSYINQAFRRIVEQVSVGQGLDKWDSIEKGKLKMTLQLKFLTRVDSGLLIYANDNLNNFIQLHFVDKKKICLTFNVAEKIARIEIILEDNILNSGEPIQLRVKRYLDYTVFHVLIYLREHKKYDHRSIYAKLPTQFLTKYSHRPFRPYRLNNNHFDYFYTLESDLTFKFVNFDDETDEGQTIDEIDEDEITHVDILNTNETFNQEKANLESESIANIPKQTNTTGDRKTLNAVVKNLIFNSSKIITSSGLSTNYTNTSTLNQNKFAEQVIPVRGYFKQQVDFPTQMIELTDTAETYVGLINNLDKIIEDEFEFLKPLHLIYLANLNNFDSYFGLNKTFNTSTISLTKNIVQSITTSVLQKNKTTKDVKPLLTLLNTTITKINFTEGFNHSLDNSLHDTLKNSLKSGALDNTTQQINLIQQLNVTQSKIIEQSNSTVIQSSNKIDTLINRNEKKLNLTSSFNNQNYSQIYIGNVDNNNTLSSLPPFVGVISGVIFNNQLINLTKITAKRYKNELESGKILKGVNMLCTIKSCQNSGQCLDDWKLNQTICNCSRTSYTGDTCTEDLGSSFNSYNHLFYRFEARKSRDFLEGELELELAFNFNNDDYFFEKSYYYPSQEIEENNLHRQHYRILSFDTNDSSKDKWNSDKRILLLIIYETRYVYVVFNVKEETLILSDVDNKGNELNLKIKSKLNQTFFDEYRHYIRYNRKERTFWLDDKQYEVKFYEKIVKHFYLPNLMAYGVYISGKPKRDKRWADNWNGWLGSICNVKIIINRQTIEPFNNAFNAVNMSFIQIKGSIRQARCAAFNPRNKFESKENSLPYRKSELLNFAWTVPEPEFITFDHSLYTRTEQDPILFYSIGLSAIIFFCLIPISIYVLLSTLNIERKMLQDYRFGTKKRKKSRSVDSVYQGEIRLIK